MCRRGRSRIPRNLQSQLSLNYVGCELVDLLSDVIARLDRAIQYSAGDVVASDSWLLDALLEATAVRHGLCLKECTALILLDSSWLRIILTLERINAVPHQNIVFHDVLKHIPWRTVDQLVEQHDADWDDRCIKTRAHLIAMLYAQFFGAR